MCHKFTARGLQPIIPERNNGFRTLLLLTIIMIISCRFQTFGQAAPPETERAKDVVNQLPTVAQTLRPANHPWFEQFIALERQTAVEEMVIALKNDIQFQDEKVRRLAYQALELHSAETIARGMEQFLDGVQEPDFHIRIISLQQLAKIALNDPHRVLPAIKPAWSTLGAIKEFDEKTDIGRVNSKYLQTLIMVTQRLGQNAIGNLADLSFIASRPGYSLVRRADAFKAMFAIIGTEETVKQYPTLDPKGEAALLRALAARSVETQGTFDEPLSSRTFIRQRALAALVNEDATVREWALRNIASILDRDFFTIISKNVFNK